jgi:hypothetical protein
MLELPPFYCEETREKWYTIFFFINLFKIGLQLCKVRILCCAYQQKIRKLNYPICFYYYLFSIYCASAAYRATGRSPGLKMYRKEKPLTFTLSYSVLQFYPSAYIWLSIIECWCSLHGNYVVVSANKASNQVVLRFRS